MDKQTKVVTPVPRVIFGGKPVKEISKDPAGSHSRSTPTTSAYCGLNASIVGLDGVLEAFNWSIDRILQTHKIVSFGTFEGWAEVVGCLKGASGSFQSYRPCSEIGPIAAASFYTKPSGGVVFSGALFVISNSISDEVEGIVIFDNNFTFTGDVYCQLAP